MSAQPNSALLTDAFSSLRFACGAAKRGRSAPWKIALPQKIALLALPFLLSGCQAVALGWLAQGGPGVLSEGNWPRGEGYRLHPPKQCRGRHDEAKCNQTGFEFRMNADKAEQVAGKFVGRASTYSPKIDEFVRQVLAQAKLCPRGFVDKGSRYWVSGVLYLEGECVSEPNNAMQATPETPDAPDGKRYTGTK